MKYLNFKFEHIAFFTLLAVLTASLFIFKGNTDIVYLILGALIGSFTKGNIDKKDGEK
jgi:uncharacterized membrane protein